MSEEELRRWQREALEAAEARATAAEAENAKLRAALDKAVDFLKHIALMIERHEDKETRA